MGARLERFFLPPEPDAREACLAVRGDDGEEALPALVDLSLSSPSPKPPSKPVLVKSEDACHDYDAPD